MIKPHWISKTRCTWTERRAIEVLIEIDRVDYSEALRMLIREGAKRLGVWDLACSPGGLTGSAAAYPPDTLVNSPAPNRAEVEP